MMRKPRLIEYMMVWGLLGGTLLAQLFFVILTAVPSSITEMFFMYSFMCVLAFILGGIPTYLLGLLKTLAIRLLIGDAPIHSDYQDMKTYRLRVYALSFSTIILSSSLLYFGSRSAAVSLGVVLYLFLIVAMLTYAVHRYLLRLQRYYEQAGKSKRKGKPKHEVQRLMDDVEDEEFREETDLKPGEILYNIFHDLDGFKRNHLNGINQGWSPRSNNYLKKVKG